MVQDAPADDALGHAVAQTPVQLWLLAATLLVLGAVAVRLVVLPRWRRAAAPGPADDETRLALALDAQLARWAAGAAVAGAVGAALRLAEQAATLGQSALPADAGALDGLAAAFPVGALLGTRWGHAWAVQALAFVVAAVAARAVRRRARAAVDPHTGAPTGSAAPAAGWVPLGVAALALAVVPAWLGHAAADERFPTLSIVADVVHVLGAGAWIGGLALLLAVALPLVARGGALAAGDGAPAAGRTGALAALIRAYSPLALGGAAALAASGVVGGWLRVLPAVAPPAGDGALAVPLGALLADGGPWPRILLLKLVAVAAVAALGFWHWRRATPALAAHDREPVAAPAPADATLAALDDSPFAPLPTPARRMARSMALELALAAVVLLATALLVGTQPPEPTYPADPPAAHG